MITYGTGENETLAGSVRSGSELLISFFMAPFYLCLSAGTECSIPPVELCFYGVRQYQDWSDSLDFPTSIPVIS